VPGGSTALKSFVGLDKSIRLSNLIGNGIDNIFYSWVRKTCSGYAECFEVRKPSEFWQYNLNEPSYMNFEVAQLVKPSGYITVSLRSRMTFDYGYAAFRVKLPAKYSGGPYLWFGFEADDYFIGGVAHFGYNVADGTLTAFAGGWNGQAKNDLTSWLPSDASSAYHIYEVLVKPWGVLHFIDGNLRSIIVRGTGDSPYSASNVITVGNRYKISYTQNIPTKNLALLIDIDGGDTSVQHTWNTVHPWNIRVAEGGESVPVFIPMFGSDGAYPGNLSVSGTWTSAPFPGVGKITAVFAANTSGTLTVQGNSIGGNATSFFDMESYSVTANKAVVIQIENRIQYIRFVYTPSSTPATIIQAHVVMV